MCTSESHGFSYQHPSKKSISQINSEIFPKKPGTPGVSKCLMLSKLEDDLSSVAFFDPEVVPLEVLRAEARAHPHWRHVEMGGVCVSKIRGFEWFFIILKVPFIAGFKRVKIPISLVSCSSYLS